MTCNYCGKKLVDKGTGKLYGFCSVTCADEYGDEEEDQ